MITKVEDLDYFSSMLSYVKPIESSFKPFMNEALLAEIILGNICDLKEAVEFVKSTFFYVRLKKNPAYYGVKSHKSIEIVLMEIVTESLLHLHYL